MQLIYRLSAVVLLVAPVCAMAQYKCSSPSGAVAFQQTPCAAGATQKKVELRSVAPPDAVATRAESPDERLNRSLTQDRQQREKQERKAAIQSQIDQIDVAINQRNARMQQEHADLRTQKTRARNNLAGATWEQSLSIEMQAVSDRYRAMNDVDIERQRSLRAEMDSIK